MSDLTTQQCLELLIASGGRSELAELFSTHAQAIDLMSEVAALDDDELEAFTSMLTSVRLAELFGDADEQLRIRLQNILDDDCLLVVLGRLPDDEAADVLGSLERTRMGTLLSRMRAADRQALVELLRYPEESAGGIMTKSYLSIRRDRSVGECLAMVRTRAAEVEQLQTIYVLEPNGDLAGHVHLHTILAMPRSAPLDGAVERQVISIDPYADREEAAALVARYDLNALPVVSGRQLLGVITVDDIVDVIIEEYDEDILHLAGVSREETIGTPLMSTVRMRLPWLLVNLLTAFVASSVVRAFEGTIEQVVALSAIMTVVSGMGGNAGSQTMAVVVRHLSHDNVSGREAGRGLAKEMLAGALDGLAIGLVTAAVVAAAYHNPVLAAVVLAAMVGNMVIAGTAGFLVPVTLKACHQDPAVSSSIFVTTATDVLGFLLFLGLASAALPLLT